MRQDEIRNMRLLAHDPLCGFGGMGEGMSLQKAKDGRRILWLAHEGPPKNFTGVDVTDPRRPKVIVQTELPQMNMRSNSVEVVGDILVVAYQVGVFGDKPAGVEIFDVSTPETPKSISFFDTSGPMSRGVHALWFVDGEFIHCSTGAADWTPRHKQDFQFYMTIDVRDPAKPKEAGRWWLPGTREGDEAPPPPRLQSGLRVHNTNVYPERPDRAYLGYLDAGVMILDIADKANPRCVSHFNHNPPFNGFTHTLMPLFERQLMVMTDECVRDGATDWPKLTWILDARKEDNLVPISTLPMPEFEKYAHRGGRFGSHNLHENPPSPYAFKSEEVIFATFFNAGVRAYDISNPYQPKEVACFVPEPMPGAKTGCAQINDVFVDENAILYTVDRHIGGLYTLELNL